MDFRIKKRIIQTSGFTLLETLLALGIIASAIILLSNAWTGSFMSLRKSKMNYDVAQLLQRKMTELELEYRDKPLTEIPEERAEDFGKEYPQFKWKMKSKEMEFPNISEALSSRKEGADPMTEMVVKKMFEHFGESIKEVTLTIIVTDNKKTKEFSVVTYFVDYNKQFNMSL